VDESLIKLNASYKDSFELNPLTLAYIGDAVFEIMVREYMLSTGSLRVEKLHKKVTAIVNAGSQSDMVRILEPLFTEKEEKVYKRGRNSKPATSAKNQSVSDYRRATGFEAVFGYLYLNRDFDRLNELFNAGIMAVLYKNNNNNSDCTIVTGNLIDNDIANDDTDLCIDTDNLGNNI